MIVFFGLIGVMPVFQQPRKALLDQLKTVVGENDDKLPESVILVNSQDYHGQVSKCSDGFYSSCPHLNLGICER